jgi:heme/copper-type cytochrome/quinol oxidase subunit 2
VTPFRTRTARPPVLILAACLLLSVAGAVGVVAQNKKDVSVSARRYSFKVAGSDAPEIRVQLDDLVTITFVVDADDIPHSFTIGDHYRIDRRGEPGKPVTIRFRADKAGTFAIQCTLSIDARCLKDMKATLIVEAKR